jgi:hypothetical protein
MFVRFPAPPGKLPRSLKVTRSASGEVIATAGPPLPKTPDGVWITVARRQEDNAATPLYNPASVAGSGG